MAITTHGQARVKSSVHQLPSLVQFEAKCDNYKSKKVLRKPAMEHPKSRKHCGAERFSQFEDLLITSQNVLLELVEPLGLGIRHIAKGSGRVGFAHGCWRDLRGHRRDGGGGQEMEMDGQERWRKRRKREERRRRGCWKVLSSPSTVENHHHHEALYGKVLLLPPPPQFLSFVILLCSETQHSRHKCCQGSMNYHSLLWKSHL